jgi:hypothetical protein
MEPCRPGQPVKVTTTNAGTTSKTSLAIGKGTFRFLRIVQDQTGGTGATHQPYLSTDPADTAPGTRTRGRIVTTSAAAVTVIIDEVPAQPVVFVSTGTIYLFTGFDAGADNDAVTEIYLDKIATNSDFQEVSGPDP